MHNIINVLGLFKNGAENDVFMVIGNKKMYDKQGPAGIIASKVPFSSFSSSLKPR